MNTPNITPEIKIDFHCHTTDSDGKMTPEELANHAKNLGLNIVAVTDHDRVNYVAQEKLKEFGIISPLAVEISARDYENNHSLHVLYYTQKVSEKVETLLAGIRWARIVKIQGQCLNLAKAGFNISYEAVVAYAEKQWVAADCINNGILAFFLLESDFNRKHCLTFDANIFSVQDVIDAFLKEYSTFPEIGWCKVEDYEPSIEAITNIAKEEGGVLSLAHPNFSFLRFGWIQAFENRFKKYRNLWIEWVECNPFMNEEWQNKILQISQESNAIITFGSDFHSDGNDRHEQLGNIHKNFQGTELVASNVHKLLTRIGIF